MESMSISVGIFECNESVDILNAKKQQNSKDSKGNGSEVVA